MEYIRRRALESNSADSPSDLISPMSPSDHQAEDFAHGEDSMHAADENSGNLFSIKTN